MKNDFDLILRKIIRDIRVDLSQEFDRNFERQAFFSKVWARRKSPVRGDGHILVDTGNLRRSIRAVSDDRSVTFSSDLPYASIHNEGGKIKVTAKMKRFFWAKYYDACGSFGRKKDGSKRNDKRNARLSTVAEFYKAMALMKVGSEIVIPKRQFLGAAPEVEKAVTDIIEANLTEYFEKYGDELNDKYGK